MKKVVISEVKSIQLLWWPISANREKIEKKEKEKEKKIKKKKNRKLFFPKKQNKIKQWTKME